MRRLETIEQVQSILLSELNIKYGKVEGRLFDHTDCLISCFGRTYIDTLGFEVKRKGLANRGLIIDEQDMRARLEISLNPGFATKTLGSIGKIDLDRRWVKCGRIYE